MWNGWFDVDRTMAEMDAFRRQMDLVLNALEGRQRPQNGQAQLGWSAFPEAHLENQGAELYLYAEVPGLEPGSLDLQVTAQGLTLSGERRVEVPEGYDVHRQERRNWKFSRSLTFPVKVDVDNVQAEIRRGVLTVRLPKAAEVQPRRITVES